MSRMSRMYSDNSRLSIRTYDLHVKPVTLDLGSPRQDSERPLDLRQKVGDVVDYVDFR